MRRAVPLTSLCAATALLAAGGPAQAKRVRVEATVAGGTTLSVAPLNDPSFGLTLNGDDRTVTYRARLQILDARGLGADGGWKLTIGGTVYSDGSGHTLPPSASTIASVTAGCDAGSTCVLPANTVQSAGLPIPVSPARSPFLNAAGGSGLGRIDADVNVAVTVPADTIAATYSRTLTVAVSAGP